jgi:transcription antitermination factor NusG
MATNVAQLGNAFPVPVAEPEPERWFALHTRARHEKAVTGRLNEIGIPTYLPMVTEVRRWSDRQKSIEVPIFGCYVFAKFTPKRWERLAILGVDGVLSVVGNRNAGTPIPNEQIEAVRLLVDRALPWSSHPFLQVGQRVRIRGGALDGIEGILLARSGRDTLVISIDALQRSLAVHVDGYQIQPL